ncbi:hypothetical protein KHA96_11995 [Bacillus sp. FJAT-49711]|nr:hypothetical protein [Bacillus sp. FJAT-49711]MBS4219038.1 hypothetical protein [Bacillus sp. FJAT-49711]
MLENGIFIFIKNNTVKRKILWLIVDEEVIAFLYRTAVWKMAIHCEL